jgi:hypothetical protein
MGLNMMICWMVWPPSTVYRGWTGFKGTYYGLGCPAGAVIERVKANATWTCTKCQRGFVSKTPDSIAPCTVRCSYTTVTHSPPFFLMLIIQWMDGIDRILAMCNTYIYSYNRIIRM